MKDDNYDNIIPTLFFPDGKTVPLVLTEEELIIFLRIPEVSKSVNHHNVIENLIRFHDLPRILLCKKRLYPCKAILAWIDKQTIFK